MEIYFFFFGNLYGDIYLIIIINHCRIVRFEYALTGIIDVFFTEKLSGKFKSYWIEPF